MSLLQAGRPQAGGSVVQLGLLDSKLTGLTGNCIGHTSSPYPTTLSWYLPPIQEITNSLTITLIELTES